MKILILSNSCWNIFNFRYPLIKNFITKKYEIYIIAPKDKYLQKLTYLGIKVIPNQLNPSGLNPISEFWTLFKYFIKIKKIKPDLILTFTIKPNIYGNFVAGLLKIPIINNVSGLGSFYLSKKHSFFFQKILYKFSFLFSSKVLFQNNSDQFEFINNGIISENKTSLVPGSGIDLEKFDFHRTENYGKKILFIGRILRDKGIIEFIEASKNISKIKSDIKFIIAGNLNSNNISAIKLKEFRKLIFNNDRIEYVGIVDDIYSLLKEIDVVVLPSYREGMSKSLLEAAAMMIPIITTDVPGCKEIVLDGISGYLCKPMSTKSLERSILKVINLNSKQRVAMGYIARNHIEKNFTDKIVVDIYNKEINLIFKN